MDPTSPPPNLCGEAARPLNAVDILVLAQACEEIRLPPQSPDEGRDRASHSPGLDAWDGTCKDKAGVSTSLLRAANDTEPCPYQQTVILFITVLLIT